MSMQRAQLSLVVLLVEDRFHLQLSSSLSHLFCPLVCSPPSLSCSLLRVVASS